MVLVVLYLSWINDVLFCTNKVIQGVLELDLEKNSDITNN